MKTKFLISIVCLISTSYMLEAQKALPIQVNSLIAKIPLPQNCVSDYHNCDIVTDTSSGSVSIKDPGPTIMEIQSELENDMKDLTSGEMSNTAMPAMPSQAQIEQMKQQAMQMQGMTPEQARQMSRNNASQATDNPEKMKELGNAQTAIMQINMLINELSLKASSLGGENKQKIDKIHQAPPCPDVKVGAGDVAVPTCECLKSRSLEYYSKRVAEENNFLQQLDNLLQSYFPKIKQEIAIIDDAERDLNYGEAIVNPAFKNQAVIVQQQALGAVPVLVSMAGNAIKDSGNEYANIVNTDNGTLIGCRK